MLRASLADVLGEETERRRIGREGSPRQSRLTRARSLYAGRLRGSPKRGTARPPASLYARDARPYARRRRPLGDHEHGPAEHAPLLDVIAEAL
jgi:hypothetical protein